jgi:hypothetical protein
MEIVNGMFRKYAATLPCFRQTAASIRPPKRKFGGTVTPYGAVLLTMIKDD